MTAAQYEALRRQRIESGAVFADYVIRKMGELLHWHIQLYQSRHYQISQGEGPSCTEVKNDTVYKQSRHLWIEVAEKARPRGGPFVPSGICRADNTVLYAIGDFDTIFIFLRQTLRSLHDLKRYPIRENKTHTSEGFRVPEDVAKALAIVLQPHADQKILKLSSEMQALDRQLVRDMLADPRQPSLFDLV